MRVLIADRHPKTTRALKILLQEEPGVSLICEAFDAESLLELAQNKVIDLVLLDEEIPGKPIKEMIFELHSLEPRPKVILMSNNPEKGRMFLDAGADAFLSKSNQPDWLLAAVRNLI